MRMKIIPKYQFQSIINQKNKYRTEINNKLKSLELQMHLNKLPEKKSACFWCTYDFDSPNVYIPKDYTTTGYKVYGCFCSPECAVAYLFREKLDTYTIHQR